ncbi:hypothetical protein BP6252_08599 [Coleophoma cylindrospora]|uniref:Uncharacterized protein n=1 Tax=Coleophoma cylindrospora TaxID=1849047 RepID=A0A3D8R6B1_9HELO|nr:hypothetical protein BP6252_08599 [Coleophoma cylindrospora]
MFRPNLPVAGPGHGPFFKSQFPLPSMNQNSHQARERRVSTPNARVHNKKDRKTFAATRPDPGPLQTLIRFPDQSTLFPNSAFKAFEELHAERSYLLQVLQDHNAKATNLLKQLSHLEEAVAKNGQARRKTTKQMGWVRSRLRECTQQEKTTLARLGEVTHEIQIKDRLAQVESERREHEQLLSHQHAMFQTKPFNLPPPPPPPPPAFPFYPDPGFQCQFVPGPPPEQPLLQQDINMPGWATGPAYFPTQYPVPTPYIPMPMHVWQDPYHASHNRSPEGEETENWDSIGPMDEAAPTPPASSAPHSQPAQDLPSPPISPVPSTPAVGARTSSLSAIWSNLCYAATSPSTNASRRTSTSTHATHSPLGLSLLAFKRHSAPANAKSAAMPSVMNDQLLGWSARWDARTLKALGFHVALQAGLEYGNE